MKTLLLFLLSQLPPQTLFKFKEHDVVTLKQDTILFFNSVPQRKGTAGEKFTVVKYDPSGHRIFVLSADESGKPIALNTSEAFWTLGDVAQTPVAPAPAPEPVTPAVNPEPPLDSELDWSAANKSSLSIGATEAMSGKTDIREDAYEKSTVRRRRILINTHTINKAPVDVTIETLWFATPVRAKGSSGGGNLSDSIFLVSRVKNAEGRVFVNHPLMCDCEEENWSSKTTFHYIQNTADGIKPAGWIVLARTGNKVISYHTTVPSLQKMISGGGNRTINQELKEYAEDIK